MRHTRMLGLSLVAAFAIGGVASASAMAEGRPEYKRCVATEKVGGKYTGEYSNSKCTNEAPEGKFKLEEVAEGTEANGSSGGVTITANGVAVKCKHSTSTGEISSQFDGKETISFTGCSAKIGKATESCGTGGTITTSELTAGLYYINAEETEPGIALQDEGVFAEFSCGAQPFVIEGLVIGAVANSGSGPKVTFALNGSKEQAHKSAFFFESEIGPISLQSGEKEATLKMTQKVGAKGVLIHV